MKDDFRRKALAGLLIGIGCVLPGVSGGLMAVSFGLYRPMLDALTGLRRDFRGGFRYLLPIGLGGAAGYFVGAVALGFLMSRYSAPLTFLFIGLILGGVPGVVLEANAGGFRPRYLWALGLGFALSLLLTALPKSGANAANLTMPQALLTGGVQGLGTVVPGVSGSFLLIYLGWYQAYLDAVSALDWATLAPVALGFILAALVCMRGAKWLFDRATAYAHYGVLGFLLGTTILIVPPFGAGLWLLAEVAAFAGGLLGALWMGRMRQGAE